MRHAASVPRRPAVVAAAGTCLLLALACSGSQDPAPGPAAGGGGERRPERVKPAVPDTPEARMAAALAKIESDSIAAFPVGSWIKFTDSRSREITAKVENKLQGKDGWEATTSLVVAGEGAAPSMVTRVYGSVSRITRSPNEAPVASAEETVTVDGKPVACTVFTTKNGQKVWMASSVPLGGTVKVVGPNGEPFVTLVAFGQS